MLIFCYFSGCISHLSLMIILNKISIFIHSEIATGRSSAKQMFCISTKRIKICLWKCLVLIKVAGYRSATLLKLNFFTKIFQRFWSCNQLDTLQKSYFEEYLFLQNTSFNGCLHLFIKFQWLIHTFFSYWNFWIQFPNWKNKGMWFDLFLQRYCKDKVASWEFCNYRS